MTSLKGDPEVYPRVGKTDQAFRLSDGPAIQMSLNSLIAIASELEPGHPLSVGRLGGTPGAVRADGADRLILSRKLGAERPQRDTRLGRDVLNGDVLQAPLHRQPQCGHWYC